jgi:hypothetical protein
LALKGPGYGLTIRRVETLRPHERTIPENVEKVRGELQSDGVQKDPIMVDVASGAVLDGMHRLAAFRQLGIGRVVCCEVDYSSWNVALKRWARTYANDDPAGFVKAAGELGISTERTWSEALAQLEARSAPLAVLAGGRAYVAEGKGGLERSFGLVDGLDRLTAERKWARGFVPEDELDAMVKGSGKSVSLVQRLGKDDVVAAARTGNLFPCKTSMHTIDPRPVAVGFPTDRLGAATTHSLGEWLAGKTQRLLPGGSVYEGRRYKERLLLMEDR